MREILDILFTEIMHVAIALTSCQLAAKALLLCNFFVACLATSIFLKSELYDQGCYTVQRFLQGCYTVQL